MNDSPPPIDHALDEITALVASQFAKKGPPAAGSAAAVTGAIAAGLLEWTAGSLEERGSEELRPRARAIRGRAAALRSSLARASQRDMEAVRGLLDPAVSSAARVRASESVLDTATRCSQAVTLALELTPHARDAVRPDIEVAMQLAWSASVSALHLFEENLRGEEEGTEWMRGVKRRAWKVRLLLQRAAPLLRQTSSDWARDGQGMNG